MKFCVVPDSSERCTGLIVVSGSSTPLLSAAIAASFHFVIVPAKMPAAVAGVSFRPSTPGRL